MEKWNVNLKHTIDFFINVEGDTREEAINKAKEMIKNHAKIIVDNKEIKNKGLEFDMVSYVGKY